MVYELARDVERYKSLTMQDEDDFLRLPIFDGKALSQEWRAYEVEFIRDELNEDLLPGDFPAFGTVPTFSKRAVDALFDLLIENGELLPLNSSDGEFYAYNVLKVVNALDESRSDVKRFSDGGIMRVNTYAFYHRELAGQTIFKVPQLAQEFVTDSFVRRVRKSRLTGFKFVELWTSH